MCFCSFPWVGKSYFCCCIQEILVISKPKIPKTFKLAVIMPRPLFCRNGCCDPFEEKGQINLFDQNTGLPCFLEPDEVSWIDSARKRLTAFSWTASLSLPLFNSLRMEILPTCIGPQEHISDAACKRTEQNWKVCLNVNPYSLEDISMKTKEGFLEITGKRTYCFDQDCQRLHRF